MGKRPSNEHLALFQRFTVSEIAERTGYSEVYVLNIKRGAPVRELFRLKVAKHLGIPESDLFAAVTTSAA